jgi:2-polyprenyl-6-methoxyphenol hydroxylase-like FAD-dependent oxidoreductase
MPARAADAFDEWHRKGVPQLRHSHAFLARTRVVLRERAPDILAALLANGATELRFAEHMPPTIADRSPRPGDEELVALGLRRTTFEWVLRRTALDQPGVTFLSGRSVRHLSANVTAHRTHVTGVDADGDHLTAATVVDATGRSSALPRWLEELEVPAAPEQHTDVGLLYYSRFYRLPPGASPPDSEGLGGADLGFLKYAIFPGDDNTFSFTMGIAVADEELRGIHDPAVFDALAARLPGTQEWLAVGATPITDDVAVMAKMRNRMRRLVADGEPVVTGLVPVGDATVCTNPLYGRGASLALAHAFAAADLILAGKQTGEQDELTHTLLEPWYHASVMQDAMQAADGSAAFAGVFASAVRTDADVWRAFVRSFNLLDPPEAMFGNPAIQAKLAEAAAAGDTSRVVVPGAPEREEVLAIVGRPARV